MKYQMNDEQKSYLQKRSVWDDYWSGYRSSPNDRHLRRDPYAELLRRLRSEPRGDRIRILEVGCGSGFLTRSIFENGNELIETAVLIDFSPEALKLAESGVHGRSSQTALCAANALHLPFAKDSFDLVFNEGLNEHFAGAERQKIFDEMTRVCKTGGQIVIIVPNALSPLYLLEYVLLRLCRRWFYGFERPFSAVELRSRMNRAGIAVVRSGGVKIIRQFVAVARLARDIAFPMRSLPSNVPSPAPARTLQRLFFYPEALLERFFWFLGRDIGMMGHK